MDRKKEAWGKAIDEKVLSDESTINIHKILEGISWKPPPINLEDEVVADQRRA